MLGSYRSLYRLDFILIDLPLGIASLFARAKNGRRRLPAFFSRFSLNVESLSIDYRRLLLGDLRLLELTLIVKN